MATQLQQDCRPDIELISVPSGDELVPADKLRSEIENLIKVNRDQVVKHTKKFEETQVNQKKAIETLNQIITHARNLESSM